ncbi:MAG TPA: protein phosphatase 2C domain-containing protein [Thermoanaerobaculaceae bacterium]|nr:protein phosphatase 2C domain-containing protein [Thermoanaerobaculaceae bacterium]HRS15188.1 protein phosphatase 2C domain-containing protein [Thermoanaerobaculaceae bacterium]
MTRRSSLAVGALSHIGLVRRENQDRMGRFRTPQAEVFVVADGMGGHKGGAQAAAMVLEGLEKALRARPQPRSIRAALRAAASEVNSAVCAAATSGDPTTDHMGSTAVLLVVRGREVLVGHLGDSRAYLWRGGRLRQLTRDHTWVQQLVDQNLLTEEEARHHPEASVLAHAFGRQSELAIALSPALAIRRGDAVLLCSDGLSGYVEADEIAAILASHEDPQRATEALVEAALATGGHDNITVQLIVFTDPPRWHARRILGRSGVIRPPRVTVSEAEPPPPASPPAQLDLVPTEPALPLPPPPAAEAPPPRRRRLAGGVIAVATLAGAALLAVALRTLLRPAAPAGAPHTVPTATEPAGVPAPGFAGEEPTATPEPGPPPTPTPTPTAAPESDGAPPGEAL